MKKNEVKTDELVKLEIKHLSKYNGRIATVKKGSVCGRSHIFTVELEDNGEEIDIHCSHFTEYIDSGYSDDLVSKNTMWEWLSN